MDLEELMVDAADLVDRWERAATDDQRLLVARDMAGLLAAVPDYLNEEAS